MSKFQFISDLRRNRFGIGEPGLNPLASALQATIKLLSAELYQKDIHFMSELLQNAEDNTYPSHVEPSIKIVLIKEDITATGAAATLVLFNNEVGFSSKNIEALCSAGESTKAGRKSEGYIGEKGIGFKSVFLVTEQPYIISNGFRIRFNEKPDTEANLGYIVPEWVHQPDDGTLRTVYGSSHLPTTTIVLPLRREKIQEVCKQMTQIPAESLLFLSKISSLSISDQYFSPYTELILSRNIEMKSSKSDTIETCTAYLTSTCGVLSYSSDYYIFRQKFDVNPETVVDKRRGVPHWTVSLAFPVGNRIPSNRSVGDVFTFLPSDVHSGLPFLVNSDFLLVSSRETLIFDSPWNQGIFQCIPEAFLSAFTLMLHSSAFGLDEVPSASLLGMYNYVPVNQCRPHQLEQVRLGILAKLKETDVIVCATNVGCLPPSVGRLCRPSSARRVSSKFRNLLVQAPTPPPYLLSSGFYIVDESLQENHRQVLHILGVADMTSWDYYNCLNNVNWIISLPEYAYILMLEFLESQPESYYRTLTFFKYSDSRGRLLLASMNDLRSNAGLTMYWNDGESRGSSWLVRWSTEMQRWLSFNFIPSSYARNSRLKSWLQQSPFNVSELNNYTFAVKVLNLLSSNPDPKLAVLVAHFAFDLYQRDRSTFRSIEYLLKDEPIATKNHGVTQTGGLKRLLPACESQWPILLPGDTWSRKLAKMSDQYILELSTPSKKPAFLKFLSSYFGAVDLPRLPPENLALPTGNLNDFTASRLLFTWLSEHADRTMYYRNFLDSIRTASWMKTDRGYFPPSSCFLKSDKVMECLKPADVPFIDQDWLPTGVPELTKILETLGVAMEPGNGYNIVLERLRQLESLPPEKTDLTTACRLYKYLGRCPAAQSDHFKSVWIPGSTSHGPVWKIKDKCIIHDQDGLFDELNVGILNKHYPRYMLKLFHEVFGVREQAAEHMYLDLWIHWSKKGDDVDVQKCQLVWRQLLRLGNRSFTSESSRVPCIPAFHRDAITVKLLPPSSTVIVDRMELEHLFSDSDPPPWVAWYPNSHRMFHVRELYNMYTAMGVKKLSEKVSAEMDTSCMARKLVWEGGLVNRGLFKTILAYLATSQTPTTRQTLVLPLLKVREVEVDTPLRVNWSLKVDGKTYHAISKKMIEWSHEREEIAYVDDEQQRSRVKEFASEFAKTVAERLLSGHRDLIPGVEELLRTLAFLKFSMEEVDNTLLNRNLRVFDEDEQFLETGIVFVEAKPEVKEVPDEDEKKLERFTVREPVTEETKASPVVEMGPSNVDYPPRSISYNVPQTVPRQGAAPRPPPPDRRRQLLEDALATLSSFHAGLWTMEIPDDVFNSDKIVQWRLANLPTIRVFLGYPPEEGYLKPGMRSGGAEPPFNLDKLLTAAFLSPGVVDGSVTGASQQHLSVVGKACLNLVFVMELVKTDDWRGIFRELEKLTNEELLVACFRASSLRECVLLPENASAAGVGDNCAVDVMRGIIAVGYCAYDDGLEEVRRIYQEVFLPALNHVLG